MRRFSCLLCIKWRVEESKSSSNAKKYNFLVRLERRQARRKKLLGMCFPSSKKKCCTNNIKGLGLLCCLIFLALFMIKDISITLEWRFKCGKQHKFQEPDDSSMRNSSDLEKGDSEREKLKLEVRQLSSQVRLL